MSDICERDQPLTPAILSPSPLIYVFAKDYKPLSGGARSLHLLCHHLNRAGFEAYLASPHNRPITTNPDLTTPCLTSALQAKHKSEGRESIVIYPQIIGGNYLQGSIVVRYLLHKPGLSGHSALATFQPDDLYFSFAPEHVIRGTRSFDLFLPLVDHATYFPPPEGAARDGFVVLFGRRVAPDRGTFPSWLAPLRLVSKEAPIPPVELAELYRTSRAMVTFERSTAIYEAELCGCPVICFPEEHFEEAAYQPRFKGLGLVWGWNEDRLPAATDETVAFRSIYAEIEANLLDRLRTAIAWVIDQVQERRNRPARSGA